MLFKRSLRAPFAAVLCLSFGLAATAETTAPTNKKTVPAASPVAPKPGPWSAWTFVITADAAKVFQNAAGRLVGVGYTPLAFAWQVAAGTNYAFLCEAKPAVARRNVAYPVVMPVFQPLTGDPIVGKIQQVGPVPSDVPGGWTNWAFTVTADAQKVLEAALMGLTGASYKPLAFTSQVVAGTNYCFLCEGHIVAPGMPATASLVYVFQPLPEQGTPHVTEITQIATH